MVVQDISDTTTRKLHMYKIHDTDQFKRVPIRLKTAVSRLCLLPCILKKHVIIWLIYCVQLVRTACCQIQLDSCLSTSSSEEENTSMSKTVCSVQNTTHWTNMYKHRDNNKIMKNKYSFIKHKNSGSLLQNSRVNHLKNTG
jgi:hypothetical protein